VFGNQLLVANDEAILRDKARLAVKHRDARLLESLLPSRRDRIREASLESHQRGPVYAALSGDPVPKHSLMPRDGVGGANKHLLGIAAPQGARSAVRQVVCYCDPPSRGSTPGRRRRTASAGAEHHEIILLDGVCQREFSRGSFHEVAMTNRPTQKCK
jgi:hypothetical protein